MMSAPAEGPSARLEGGEGVFFHPEPFPVRVRAGGAELDRLASGLVAAPEQLGSVAALEELFGRAAPLEADLGCGDGRFLVLTALRHPERNFLGVERQAERVRKTARKAVLAGCGNVRVAQAEILPLLRGVLPPRSLARMHVLFPDPWPKRRHSKNRLLTVDFFEAAAAALAAGGELRVKTDSEAYFREAVRAARQCPFLEREEWSEPEMPVRTTFEARFLAQGLPVYAAVWRAKERGGAAGFPFEGQKTA